MGRTILLMVCLFTLIAGSIIFTINHEQSKLVNTLSEDNDMKLAKFISNTYAHNTVKDIRDSFEKGRIDIFNQLNIYPSKHVKIKDSKILDIDNASIDVEIHNQGLFNGKQLKANKEWGVISIGKVNSFICTTRVIYKKMPYSQFALFVDQFPPNVFFGDGQIIDGFVYINGKLKVGTNSTLSNQNKIKNKDNPINIAKWFTWGKNRNKSKQYPADASVVFTDLVYITEQINQKDYLTYKTGGDLSYPKDFIYYFNGFTKEAPFYGYPKISMPNDQFNIPLNILDSSLNPIIDKSKDWIKVEISLIDQFVQIRSFYEQIITISSKDWLGRTVTNKVIQIKSILNLIQLKSLYKNNNLIYINNSKVDVEVKGSLKGQLTIATEGKIYITDDIIYSSIKNNLGQFKDACIRNIYQQLPQNDDSILGLLGAKGITIKANTVNRSKQAILVMANLFTKQMIQITQDQNYNNYKWVGNEPKYFIVYGSRVQGKLQPGTYKATTTYSWVAPISSLPFWKWRVNYSNGGGLKEVLIYDRRFKEISPPCVPYTDKGARISYWDERFGKV